MKISDVSVVGIWEQNIATDAVHLAGRPLTYFSDLLYTFQCVCFPFQSWVYFRLVLFVAVSFILRCCCEQGYIPYIFPTYLYQVYQKDIDFWLLILLSVILQKMYISYKKFLVKFFALSQVNENKYIITHIFIFAYFLIPFSYLIVVARSLITVLNGGDISSHGFLSLILGYFRFFLILQYHGCVFVIYIIYYVEICSLNYQSIQDFIMKEC